MALLRLPNSRAATTEYTHELSAIYGRQFWIDDPDYALAADTEAYQKMLRDPKFAAPINFRLKSVASREWHMEPASDRPEDKAVASIFTDLLGRVRRFTQSRFNLARGVFVGSAYAYAKGSRRLLSLDGGRPQRWWVPHELEDVDKRRFRFVPDNEPKDGGGTRIRVKLEAWSVEERAWQPLSREADMATTRLIYQDREERLGYGQGLSASLWHYFWAKGTVWRDGLQGLKRWAQGIIKAKVAPRPGDTGKTASELVDEWLDVLDVMQSQHALVHDEQDELEVLETSGTGHSMAMEFFDYIDQAVSQLILGSVRTMGGDTDTGARAQGEVEERSTDVIIGYDREQLDEALTAGLVTLCWNLNRPILIELGLGAAQMPRFATSAERREDPQAVATQVETLLRSDIPLSKAEVYERTGWRAPKDDEDVFTAPSTATPGPFDPGFTAG